MQNQIKYVLPRAAWDSITIQENNECLVQLAESDRLKIGLIKKDYEASFLVRKTIAEKLILVSNSLPVGVNLILIEGYRTLKSQQAEWDRAIVRVRELERSLSYEQAQQIVRLIVAKPHSLANHHCGGAVDVTLAYSDGTLIDMGTPYISQVNDWSCKDKFPMFAKNITTDQSKNRELLRLTMEIADFVWYPGEWWHYCFGDRMWAVYSNKPSCLFGSIEI